MYIVIFCLHIIQKGQVPIIIISDLTSWSKYNSCRLKPHLTYSNPLSMESMATNFRLKLWNIWNSASSIHLQQTKPRKLNPAFNSESTDDGANTWYHYMLFKMVHFFCFYFFFFIHSIGTKPTFYFFTSYIQRLRACLLSHFSHILLFVTHGV